MCISSAEHNLCSSHGGVVKPEYVVTRGKEGQYETEGIEKFLYWRLFVIHKTEVCG